MESEESLIFVTDKGYIFNTGPSKLKKQQFGAAEARRAHNPEVARSKRAIAIWFFWTRSLYHFAFDFFHSAIAKYSSVQADQ